MNKKVNRVIASCKTKEQLECALQYVLLAGESREISVIEAAYWNGVINGIAHVNSRHHEGE